MKEGLGDKKGIKLSKGGGGMCRLKKRGGGEAIYMPGVGECLLGKRIIRNNVGEGQRETE